METLDKVHLVFEVRERHTYSAMPISKSRIFINTIYVGMAFTSYNADLISGICTHRDTQKSLSRLRSI